VAVVGSGQPISVQLSRSEDARARLAPDRRIDPAVSGSGVTHPPQRVRCGIISHPDSRLTNRACETLPRCIIPAIDGGAFRLLFMPAE
jgi:hypothetical protein